MKIIAFAGRKPVKSGQIAPARASISSNKTFAKQFKPRWKEDEEAKARATFKKVHQGIYSREHPKFLDEMLQDYNDGLCTMLKIPLQYRIYDVQDIQHELEELTEDGDDVKHLSTHEQEVWKIKCEIKKSIKKDGTPPGTEIEWYKYGRLLGKGAYGRINLCMQKLTSKLLAVKSINLGRVGNRNACKRITTEKEILRACRHPNIVKLYETIHDKTTGLELLFMELCIGGDMLQYLRKRRKLKESQAKFFMLQLLSAIGYCHHKNIVHRDIKLENVLLSNLGEIKLCDFGVAHVQRELTEDERARLKEQAQEQLNTSNDEVQEPDKYEPIYECSGTPAYMAPEVLRCGERQKKKPVKDKKKDKKKEEPVIGYGRECDIWSTGVLMYALIYGVMPFRGANVREIKDKILNENYEVMYREFITDPVSYECKELIKWMMHRDPKNRPTVQQILDHDWFKGMDKQNPQHNGPVFDETERVRMIKEYLYAEDEEKWGSLVNLRPEEKRDYAPDQFMSKLKVEDDEGADG